MGIITPLSAQLLLSLMYTLAILVFGASSTGHYTTIESGIHGSLNAGLGLGSPSAINMQFNRIAQNMI